MRAAHLLAVALLAAGCGGAHPADRSTAVPAELAAEVVSVRPAPAPDAVLVDVEVPAGAEDCVSGVRPTVLEESAQTVWFNVVYGSPRGVDVGRHCTGRRTVTVRVELTGPLADRHVAVNGMGLWARRGASYARCDDTLGCRPPADPCDPLWVDQVVLTMDVPVKRLRGVRDVLGCDGTWLVLDLNRGVGNCAPEQGGACASGHPTQRVFLRWRGPAKGWQTVAGSTTAGCREVLAAVPAFPTRLCERLTAPASASPG